MAENMRCSKMSLSGLFNSMKTKLNGKILWDKKHESSFRTEWLRDKRCWEGLLFRPLWTN